MALEKLIPGTEELYYYTCLLLQHEGKLDEVETILPLWIKRYGDSRQVEEIRNRQALLYYKSNPQKSLDFLRLRLELRFDHQKEVIGKKASHPTELNQQLISRDALTRIAMAHNQNLQGFEGRGARLGS